MDMHAAAMAPRQPHISEQDRRHSRFAEYSAYRASMSRLLVEASSFPDWLYQQERQARDNEIVTHPRYSAFLTWMRETRGGARKCPAGNVFPANFLYWLDGGRW